jgi:short-subunit dehydrogenase
MKGSVVWITGASSGIGAAVAREYAQNGARIILSARSRVKLEEVAESCRKLGGEAIVLELDLSQPDRFESVVEQAWSAFGQIDILINNGGVSQRSELAVTDPEVLREIMEINFFGSALLTRCLIPRMIEQKSGKIGVVTSMTGLFGFPLRTAYAASKHALHGFFESLALEVRDQGIRITLIAPGRINTPISLSARTADGSQHGEMDPGQKNGIPAEVCAKKIVRGIQRSKPLLIIARGERILYWTKKLSLSWFYRLASRVSAK